MKLIEHRIKSFTLIEVLIAIIIASLAIGFSITVLINLQNLFNKKIKYDDQIEELNSFISVFKNDVDLSSEIYSGDQTLHILKDSLIIDYNFYSGTVIRSNVYQSDTFRIKYSGIEFTPVWVNKNLVQDIKINLNDKFIKYITFYKDYSYETLFKLNSQENGH
jgi:type II secretory pathway pseudopilin PulG